MKVTYKLNPAFFIILFFVSLVGYLINDVRGAVWGAVIMLSISFTIQIIDFFVNINKSEAEKAMDEIKRYYGRK